MLLHLNIIGCVLLCLALLHGIFPRYFRWREELAGLSLMNRQMMTIHTFFIAVTVAGMGVLCLVAGDDLLNTPLGRKVCFGFAFFWALRLGIQFFGYSPQLWRGKRFETAVHIVFTLLWAYLTVVFLLAYFY
ncbi:MAG: hypothetical protein EOO08_01780 [Chitinophagaceae bacterium]|nr:MAG: hypothetical protein EOO08_01780 [Chitinophagaceae bacterium]